MIDRRLVEDSARYIMTALPDTFGNNVVQGLKASSAAIGSLAASYCDYTNMPGKEPGLSSLFRYVEPIGL
jgi:hypothetical protein